MFLFGVPHKNGSDYFEKCRLKMPDAAIFIQ